MNILSGQVSRFQGLPVWPVFEQGKQTHIIAPPSEGIDYRKYDYGDYRISVNFTPRKQQNNLVCPTANFGEVHVTYKGHLLPCCMYHADLYFDHPSNDAYRAIMGDLDKINVNLRSLEDIFSDPDYYEKRFEDMLTSGKLLTRCEQRCGSYLKKYQK